ncbi:Hypothetical predicted protein [Pelobates cultripes]|uniref:Uncharacterized protein n=1 Tax=Pelobates cultripes TaxID=61616 RepID=A0AAD1T206_PELCU|nr:Hypothetical predicted protein [Pelobates cultripes]
MPFLYTPMGRKPRQCSGAYHTPPHAKACMLDWVNTLEALSLSRVPTTNHQYSVNKMGRRSQKPQTSGNKDTCDIGVLLQRTPAKRASPNPDPEVYSTCSDMPVVTPTDRWGTLRSLMAVHNGAMAKLTSLMEAPSFLRSPGLSPQPMHTAEPSNFHRWDPARSVPFMPRYGERLGAAT